MEEDISSNVGGVRTLRGVGPVATGGSLLIVSASSGVKSPPPLHSHFDLRGSAAVGPQQGAVVHNDSKWRL